MHTYTAIPNIDHLQANIHMTQSHGSATAHTTVLWLSHVTKPCCAVAYSHVPYTNTSHHTLVCPFPAMVQRYCHKAGIPCEKKQLFANKMNFLSEEMFTISEYQEYEIATQL